MSAAGKAHGRAIVERARTSLTCGAVPSFTTSTRSSVCPTFRQPDYMTRVLEESDADSTASSSLQLTGDNVWTHPGRFWSSIPRRMR